MIVDATRPPLPKIDVMPEPEPEVRKLINFFVIFFFKKNMLMTFATPGRRNRYFGQ